MLSTSRWYTAVGFAALVRCRPTTRWVAPRRTASAGVTVRRWSAVASPGSLIPGTTIKSCGPRAARSNASSRPEATTPRSPAVTASRASRPLGRSNATMSSAMRQLSGDALRHARVGERGGADRDQRRAGGEVLARVVGRTDPADADHRDRHVVAHAPRRQHTDRQEGRPAHATGAVDEHAGAPQLPREPRKLVRAHRLEARVGQSHGVEHAPREFGDARRCMASPSLRRNGLGDDAAQGVEVDHTAHFAAEAGGAGGEENGVLKRDAEQLDWRHRPPAGATTASLRSNSSRYATIPSATAVASLCWPRLEARNAPSVRFVAKPVSTRMAGRRAVVSTMNTACCTP